MTIRLVLIYNDGRVYQQDFETIDQIPVRVNEIFTGHFYSPKEIAVGYISENNKLRPIDIDQIKKEYSKV